MQLCNAAVRAESPRAVAVNEADGTVFAIYREHAFMGIPAKTRGEV